MEQNNIWMRYLTLGGIFSLLVLCNSCKKQFHRDGIFNFINQTNHTITYDILFQEYNVAPNATIVIRQTQDGNEKFDPDKYFSPFLMRTKGPINIKFDNSKCLNDQTIYSIHSVLDIKSFVGKKVDNFTYNFTYTFTEADYNRATSCP